jgi:hypothetical protein
MYACLYLCRVLEQLWSARLRPSEVVQQMGGCLPGKQLVLEAALCSMHVAATTERTCKGGMTAATRFSTTQHVLTCCSCCGCQPMVGTGGGGGGLRGVCSCSSCMQVGLQGQLPGRHNCGLEHPPLAADEVNGRRQGQGVCGWLCASSTELMPLVVAVGVAVDVWAGRRGTRCGTLQQSRGAGAGHCQVPCSGSGSTASRPLVIDVK